MIPSRTREVFEQITGHPLYLNLRLPAETGIGWPVVAVAARRAYLKLVLYPRSRTPAGRVELRPPFATLTFTWSPRLQPVEFVDLRYRSPDPALDWSSPLGGWPHPGCPAGEAYRVERDTLFAAYDRLLDGIDAGRRADPATEQALRAGLAVLAEPALLPHYRAIAPRFAERFLPTPVTAGRPS